MFTTSFSNHPLALEIDNTRHNTFMRLALPHLIVGLFTAALIFLILQDYAIESAMSIWITANLILLTCTVIFYTLYYLKGELITTANWGKITFVVSLLWGACWSLPPFILLDTKNILYIGILVVFVVSISTVPAPVLVHYPSAYFIFITLPLGSLTLKISMISIENQALIQLMPPFLWISLLIYGWDLHKTVIESIRLRLENKQALDEARQANTEKSRFIAAASHDIRQPLQAAVLSLDAIKAKKGKNLDTLLPIMDKSIDSLSDLITGLLDISKLDSGTIEAHPDHIELSKVINGIFDKNTLSAQAKNLQLTHNLSAEKTDNPVVFCDLILLDRALNNLLNNAIRYTDNGGVSINTYREDSHFTIQVKDTGVGINSDHLELIFKEFYQVNAVERDNKIGLGLGLSILKRLCDLQNWKLSVESVPGEGSCFSVRVPAGSRSDIKPSESTPDYCLSDISVLIIDNNITVRTALSEMLSAWQCNVIHSASAQSAIDQLKRKNTRPLDIVISDYQLADNKNGIDAIKAIQEYSGTDIAAILMTGDTTSEKLNLLAESGVSVMHKPIKPGYIRTFIHRRCYPRRSIISGNSGRQSS